MKLCYMPHTKVVLWYFTWFGCEPPDRRVCLALSVQEPSFRCRGLAGSSPSARSGWSRTSHRSQIPQSTPWINKDLQTFESHPRYWFSEQGCCCWGQTFQTKIKSGRKENSYLAYSSNQSATEAFSQPPWSCNPQRHIWILNFPTSMFSILTPPLRSLIKQWPAGLVANPSGKESLPGQYRLPATRLKKCKMVSKSKSKSPIRLW